MKDITNIDEARPHLAGSGYCPRCDHEWCAVIMEQAIVPELECPKCGVQKGIFVFGPLTRRNHAFLIKLLNTSTVENNKLKEALLWMDSEISDEIENKGVTSGLLYPFKDKIKELLDR
jgi:hypothetical protein